MAPTRRERSRGLAFTLALLLGAYMLVSSFAPAWAASCSWDGSTLSIVGSASNDFVAVYVTETSLGVDVYVSNVPAASCLWGSAISSSAWNVTVDTGDGNDTFTVDMSAASSGTVMPGVTANMGVSGPPYFSSDYLRIYGTPFSDVIAAPIATVGPTHERPGRRTNRDCRRRFSRG